MQWLHTSHMFALQVPIDTFILTLAPTATNPASQHVAVQPTQIPRVDLLLTIRLDGTRFNDVITHFVASRSVWGPTLMRSASDGRENASNRLSVVFIGPNVNHRNLIIAAHKRKSRGVAHSYLLALQELQGCQLYSVLLPNVETVTGSLLCMTPPRRC